MSSELERGVRQGFGFALGAMIAVVIVCCVLILVMILFSFAVG
jgi:ABC-type sugar transport system permease subunit